VLLNHRPKNQDLLEELTVITKVKSEETSQTNRNSLGCGETVNQSAQKICRGFSSSASSACAEECLSTTGPGGTDEIGGGGSSHP